MKLEDLILWACFGAGAGRLIAKDTIVTLWRNKALKALGVKWAGGDELDDNGDIAAMIRDLGLEPVSTDAPLEAPTYKRALTASGLVCPSCMSWHSIFWARVVIEPRGITRPRWWRDTFAAWGVASILTRVGG